MGRIKITLRSYTISRGRRSLYLDYYPKIPHPTTGKRIRFETLGMYIYAKPKEDFQKLHNNTTKAQAEAIWGLRQQSVINQEFDFLDEGKYKGDFLAYFDKYAAGNGPTWKSAFNHFELFMNGHCTFADITLDKCQEYKRYILRAPNSRDAQKTLHTNTAANYFKIFKYVVGFAHRDKWLKENIFQSFDYLPTKETHRDFLTPAELMNFSKAPCEIDVLKRASLFSCLTGLRLSDVEALEWKQIVPNIADSGFNIRLRTEKTDKELTLPYICFNASAWNRSISKVFP